MLHGNSKIKFSECVHPIKGLENQKYAITPRFSVETIEINTIGL